MPNLDALDQSDQEGLPDVWNTNPLLAVFPASDDPISSKKSSPKRSSVEGVFGQVVTEQTSAQGSGQAGIDDPGFGTTGVVVFHAVPHPCVFDGLVFGNSGAIGFPETISAIDRAFAFFVPV